MKYYGTFTSEDPKILEFIYELKPTIVRKNGQQSLIYQSLNDSPYPNEAIEIPVTDFSANTYQLVNDIVTLVEGTPYESPVIEADNGLEYEIQKDVDWHILEKDIRSINYKTELNTLVSYTPEYIIHDEGVNSGLLDKTNYYRGWVDDSNKGTLVLSVEEVYSIDESDDTMEISGNPVTQREKEWKYAKTSNGQLDEGKTKKKKKLYNTRYKRHKEGKKRRDNIIEQLIDNVGMAGLLSGIFISEADAHEKLTSLKQYHSNAFDGWLDSGRGSLYDDLTNDSTNTWLNDSISNASNQPNIQRTAIAPIEFTPVVHMMDLTMRDYIVSKVKGNIK